MCERGVYTRRDDGFPGARSAINVKRGGVTGRAAGVYLVLGEVANPAMWRARTGGRPLRSALVLLVLPEAVQQKGKRGEVQHVAGKSEDVHFSMEQHYRARALKARDGDATSGKACRAQGVLTLCDINR